MSPLSVPHLSRLSVLVAVVSTSLFACQKEAAEPQTAASATERHPKSPAAAEPDAESTVATEKKSVATGPSRPRPQHEAAKAEFREEAADADLAAPPPLAVAPARAPSGSGMALGLAGSAPQAMNTERYAHVAENAFRMAQTTPLSTFSIDVDTASYSNVRRMLSQGQAIPTGAVRVEEMINYFSYAYPEPTGPHPFSVTTEVSYAPWEPAHKLVLVGLQGRHVAPREMPARNLVFLLDVSGSMDSPNKLPLLKQSFAALLDTLDGDDRVAIVVYAGASGLVLPATRASERTAILGALERLSAGGSTNGAEGIELAYQIAEGVAQQGSINRVILATDGDFNVGTTSESDLVRLIEKKRQSGVSLTVLGFGMGNYNDSSLESLADKGNGNYAYIDTLREAQKVLVAEASGTLMTIAKDVKIQVEFNPAAVGAYRLIGYDNRRLQDDEFQDDKKDAGDIGAGHSVTALYEILSPEQARALPAVAALKYQNTTPHSNLGSEMLTVKLRYKMPEASASTALSVVVPNAAKALPAASDNLRFAAAVATFGMYLARSEYGGASRPELARSIAAGALAYDPNGYRREFLHLTSLLTDDGAAAVAR